VDSRLVRTYTRCRRRGGDGVHASDRPTIITNQVIAMKM
jgi:hypothetical protein